jgi:uncharacterized RDD family membrane protein YckC
MTVSEHASAVPAAARKYQGRRAGIVTRTTAAVVDALVVVGIVAAVYLTIAGAAFLVNPRSFHWPNNLGWSLPVVGFVVVVPYLTLTWCTTGRSYGDALFGLRVVNAHGKRMGLVVAALRAVLYVIFPIGLFWVAVSRKNKSLQDIALRTSVIYDWVPKPTLTTGPFERDQEA